MTVPAKSSLGGQMSMPPQQGLGRDDAGNGAQSPEADLLGSGGESTELCIVEPQSATSMQFLEHPDFLLQIVNDILLMAIHPPSQTTKQESQSIHHPRLRVMRPPPTNPMVFFVMMFSFRLNCSLTALIQGAVYIIQIPPRITRPPQTDFSMVSPLDCSFQLRKRCTHSVEVPARMMTLQWPRP